MSAVYCHECGAKLLPNAKFCSKCGTDIPIGQPAEQPQQVQTSGFCAKCGAPLLVGAVCCSKCGADVDQPAANTTNTFQQFAPMQSFPQPQGFQQQFSQVQNAAARLGELTSAPAGQGEFSAGIGELGNAAVRAAGSRFGVGSIGSILAGLTAGGASFAAIWKGSDPVKLSAAISAAAVVLRIIIGLIRGRRR